MSEIVHSSLTTTIKDTTLVFFGLVASILLWFSSKILIIRSTSQEELGIYSLAVAIVSICALVAGAGLQSGAARYISIFLGEGRRNDAYEVAKASIRLGTLFSLAVVLILYIAAGPISQYIFYKQELMMPLKILSPFIFFSVISGILIGITRGYGFIAPRVFYLNIGQPIFFLILLSVFFIEKFHFLNIFYSYSLAMFAVFVGIGIYSYKKIGLTPFELKGGRFKKELLRFTIPLLGATVMSMVFDWTDTLMLGRYARVEDVGMYNVSISLAKLMTFALDATAFVFISIAGELYAKRQMSELKRTYQVLTKWVFSITLPLFFILFFFPEMTISFLYGDRYIGSYIPLRILAAGFLFNAFLGVNGMLLTVFGLTRTLMNVSLSGAALNIILNYAFIKRCGYGTKGAATSTMISYLFINISYSTALYRHAKIHPITSRYIKPVLSSSLIGLIIYAIAKNLPLYYWTLPMYFILFLIGYFLSLLLTRSLDSEDIKLIEALSQKTGLKMRLLKKLVYRFAYH
jgi:O-antigen/teichoic acid export membrane protein